MLKHMMEYNPRRDENVIVRGVSSTAQAVATLKNFTTYKNVIVDLPLEQTVDFARRARQADLMSGYYHFHFTTMVSCSSVVLFFLFLAFLSNFSWLVFVAKSPVSRQNVLLKETLDFKICYQLQ